MNMNMKRFFVFLATTAVVFLGLHVSLVAQNALTYREILNKVWDKANGRLMTTPWAGAQQAFESETTIWNNVYDASNKMLRVSGGGGGGGGDFSSNTATSVDGEVVLFNGTGGKTGKRATGSGVAHLSSGVLSASAVNLATEVTGNLAVTSLGGGSGASNTTFWRGDGTWVTPGVIAPANQPFINVKLPPYNAVGDGAVDDTAAIQDALDDAATANPANSQGGGIVYLPPGTYKISFLAVPTPVMLQGSNMFGGTVLLQINGVNGDAVRLKCSDIDGYFYGGVSGMSILKQTPVTDTLGSGVGVTRTSGTCSLGETARISELYVEKFPVAGVQVLQGSAPLRITHISSFYNGQFGVDLRGQHQTVLLDSISGDNNGTALINVDGTGSTYDATIFHISNVKGETKQAALGGSPQPTVVLLKELVNARVTIENISATRGGDGLNDPQELVKFVGNKPLYTRLTDAACSGCVNRLTDAGSSFVVPWSNDMSEVIYRSDGTYLMEGKNRTVVLTDSGTITPNADTTDDGVVNTLSQATLFANPTGTPKDQQWLGLRIKSTTSRALTWGSAYAASTMLALPTATAGGGVVDYFGFRYNSDLSKWDFVATTSSPGGDVTGASTTTFTNKTLDVEATGNVVTTVEKWWFPAAICRNATAESLWDLPTSNPAVAVCITNSNTQKGAAQFADGTNLSMQTERMLPADWVGAVDVVLLWGSNVGDGQNAIWNVSTSCAAVGEVDNNAFNTPNAITDAAAGTANHLNVATATGITMTGCAAGELWHLKVDRNTGAAGDNHGGNAYVVGVEVTIRRAQ